MTEHLLLYFIPKYQKMKNKLRNHICNLNSKTGIFLSYQKENKLKKIDLFLPLSTPILKISNTNVGIMLEMLSYPIK